MANTTKAVGAKAKSVEAAPVEEAVDTAATTEDEAAPVGRTFPCYARRNVTWHNIKSTQYFTVLAADPSGKMICYSEGTNICSISADELEFA